MFHKNRIEQLFYLGCIGLIISCTSCNDKETTLFNELSSSDTGITFNNALTYGDELTVLEFEYMYNGAGVAVADFDLDGLQDIYFTGNFLNQLRDS